MPFEGSSLSAPQNRYLWPPFALCVLLLSSLAAAGQQCGGGGCCANETQCYYDGSGEVCDQATCQCVPGNSPIIVDTTGRGFHLTSAEAGVTFDIHGDGHPIRIAWTAAGSGNAFLALDRNGNGKIDNGKELFGNFTKQPKSSDPNGYLALAEFDKPENGGNGDGIIDSRDAIFPSLLLWIDENHDGISQPSELHTLPELGVYSIGLRYRDDRHYFDQYGNWFHYQAALNPDPHDGESKDGRLTYDVFFTTDGQGHSVRSSAIPKKSVFEPSLLADLRADSAAPSLSAAVTSPAQLGGYRSSLIVDNNGTPQVQVWNDSDSSITGLAITVDLSDDVNKVESRTYYDAYVNVGRDLPIYPHEPREIPIFSVVGSDVTRLIPKVRAVIFSDGTTVGEQVWIDALLGRRRHLCAALIRLHGILAQQAGTMRPQGLAELVKAAKADMQKDVMDDEFRSQVDDLAFESAIETFSAARSADSTRALSSYIQHLAARIRGLKRSKPGVQEVPSTPAVVPPPFEGSQSAKRNTPLPLPLVDIAGNIKGPRLLRSSLKAGLGFGGMVPDAYTCSYVSATMANLALNECGPSYTFTATLKLQTHDTTKGTTTNVTYALPPETVSGTCYAAYTDCNGTPQPAADFAATGSGGMSTEPTYYNFFYTLGNWSTAPPPQRCACDAPDPTGVIQDSPTKTLTITTAIVVSRVTACP